MELGINIAQEEKKAGQKARRKLRKEIHRRMYDMVSVGKTKWKSDKEDSLTTTTVRLVMERDGSGMDALMISIPRHGLIHARGWTPENGTREYQYPYLLEALYDSKIIEALADDLAQIRGDNVTDMMLKGFPIKQ